VPFTDKDGHLTKAFQSEKHDAANLLLKNMSSKTGVVAD